MNKAVKNILFCIINSIQPKTDFNTKNKGYHDICYEIYQAALKAGYPFVSINEEMFIFTGTYLESIDSHTTKIFLKTAYGKLCGDKVAASKKETINDLFSQLPYTAMTLDVKQAVDKINFQNGTLDLQTMGLVRHDWKDYFRYMLPYDYDPVANCPAFKKYLDEVMPEQEARRKAEKLANEDARFALPNACETKMVVTMNARSLHNFFRLRCCERAQWEIRALAEEMLRLVYPVAPHLFRTAGPGCLAGPCPEGRMCCGHPDEVRERYRALRREAEA